MKNQIITLGLVFATIAVSCDSVKEKTKETINEGGEVVGKTATEFIEGVTEGVDKTLQCELILSPGLQDKGLKTGKFSVENDTSGGENNLLMLYLIFDKDFNGEITVKAMDKNGLECGRSKIKAEGKAGEARYYDFRFDPRTNIEVKGKLFIE